ncbi:COP9 signalosome complex subunit 3-like [Paramacrobiotus metropolitanus]|uniref:COP9 signalosome complex subunit 3-like n=1 Tax=Paramacrobiotus metropolitanus TaxID=2943436 RepID=UPI002445DA72|nr:COP9 signalosome complex subunit 3-like [Paramacrobiotus metropolitanus]
MQSAEDVVSLLLKAEQGAKPHEELRGHFAEFVQQLRKFPVNELNNAMQRVDARHHPSPVAVVLAAKTGLGQASVDSLLLQIRHLLEQHLTAQGKLAPALDSHVVCLLMKQLAERLLRDNAAYAGLDLFLAVIKLIQDNPHQLTEIHPLFLQLSLASNSVKSALELLETEINDISSQKMSDVQSCVAYFYSAAQILSANNFFISALRNIQTIFYMPGAATAMHATVTEAYKKYLLLVLLAKYRGTGLPKTVANYMENHTKKAVAAYQALHDAFLADTFDPVALQNIAHQHAAVFNQDGNMGLVQQCLKRYRVKELIKHAGVFENMELQVLMHKLQITQPELLESFLLDMYTYSDFLGRIDMGRKIVVFRKKALVMLPEQAFESLQTSLSHVQSVMDAASSVEKDIILNTDYLRKMVQGEPGMRDEWGSMFGMEMGMGMGSLGMGMGPMGMGSYGMGLGPYASSGNGYGFPSPPSTRSGRRSP